MNKKIFLEQVSLSDKSFEDEDKINYAMPDYLPETHYLEVSNSNYYKGLLVLRSNIKHACDFYWSQIALAYNVDLFMMTPSVSSPMGPGSDSEAVEIKFGNLKTYLVDSSQFGFEPIVLNGIDRVYCYLPSMRGENPDKRHLNQFYHCEAEIKGSMEELVPLMENFIKFLAETLLSMPNIVRLLSNNPGKSFIGINNLFNSKKFIEIEFSDALKMLRENNFEEYINTTKYGSDISSLGELELMKLLKSDIPIWIKNFDRDRVAFYQKPHMENKDKVINRDFLFPQLDDESFWGEVVGAGQRQNNAEEMLESLKRQNISYEPYEWYINLRKSEKYGTTSGFGLGVERFISWALCKKDIKDVIFYPRLKNIITYP